jgi:hypothetical protein
MSTLPAVTMQDLELEHAELLPSRETLNVCNRHSSGSSFSFTQVVGSGNGNHDGNGNIGLVNLGNGSLDGNLNGNTIIIG